MEPELVESVQHSRSVEVSLPLPQQYLTPSEENALERHLKLIT